MGFFSRRTRQAPPSMDEELAESQRAYLFVKKGERRWFRINPNGTLTLVKDSPPAYGLAISFDEDEARLVVGKRLSYQQAYRELRRERGIYPAVINASAQHRVVYGVDEGAAQMFPNITIPLLYLLDKLTWQVVDGSEVPTVAVVLFGEGGGQVSHCLVVGINADRQIAHTPLTAVNASDPTAPLNNALRMMTANGALRGLPYDPASAAGGNATQKAMEADFLAQRVVRIYLGDLLEAAAGESGYPREPIWRGTPTRVVQQRAAIAVTLATALAWSGVALVVKQIGAIKQETASIQAQSASRQSDLKTLIGSRVDGFARALSLNPQSLVATAGEIWREGTKVQLDASIAGAKLQVLVPTNRANNVPGLDRRATNLAVPEELTAAVMQSPAPSGWAKSGIETSGDLNAFSVAYTSNPVDVGLLGLVGLGSPTGPVQVAAAQPGKGGADQGSTITRRK